MGYTTYFSGDVSVTPPLNEDEISFLRDFNNTRRMHRSGGPLFVKGEGPYGQDHGPDTIHDSNKPDPDQPGLWCQWVPTDDGTAIEWDTGEKFYEATEWMEYIVNRLLSPAARSYVDQHVSEDSRLKSFTCDHVVTGEIYADGEDSEDNWKIKVTNNLVEVFEASMSYGDEVPEVVPPTEAEVREALKSLGAKTKVTVYSLTTDVDEVHTSVFATEQECYESLKENFCHGEEFDVTTTEGAGKMIDWLTEEQGVVLYIDEHAVEVPA